MMADHENKSVIRAAFNIKQNEDNTQADQQEKLKITLKAAGAVIYGLYKAKETNKELAVILTILKENGSYKELGYPDFGDFVQKEIGISPAKAYELTKQVNSLGDNTYSNLNKIGIGYNAMKALRKGIEEQTVQTEDDGNYIEIGEDIIEIKPENSQYIKDAIKNLKDQTDKLNDIINQNAQETIELKEKYDKATTIRDLETEEFTDLCNAFHIKIQGELNQLQKLHKQSKLSNPKSAVFIGLMNQLNELNADNFDFYVNGIINTEIEKKSSKKK